MDATCHSAMVLVRVRSCGGVAMLISSPDGDVQLTTGAGSATALHVRKTGPPSSTLFMSGVKYVICGTVQANELSGIFRMYPRDGVMHSSFNPCLLDFVLFSQSRYQSSSQLQCSGFPVNTNVPILFSKGRSDSSNTCTLFDCMSSTRRPPSAYGLSSLASILDIRLFETLR